jgi:DNA-binding transcriptional regulator GbsR (MarR family)
MSMTGSARDEGLRAYVEEYGRFVESLGRFPRMAGRILGLLLVSAEPYLSQADLSRDLQASAGAVSSTLRLLLETGLVERLSVPGERKDFYRLSEDSWTLDLESGVRTTQRLVELAEKGMELGADLGEHAQRRLEAQYDVAVLSLQHRKRLLDAWVEHRSAVPTSAS